MLKVTAGATGHVKRTGHGRAASEGIARERPAGWMTPELGRVPRSDEVAERASTGCACSQFIESFVAPLAFSAGLGLIPVASPKWAITSASIGSVFARWPTALAKARICKPLGYSDGRSAFWAAYR